MMLRAKRPALPTAFTPREFFGAMRWIDKSPLLEHIEPYRLRLFDRFFAERDETGRPRFNLALCGRGKKNAKTLDLVLAELLAVMEESSSGSQCYLLANDKDQASDDLALLKKLITMNGFLTDALKVKKHIIERRDGNGFIEVLPAQDVAGAHGKSYRLAGFDEIHGYKTWDIFEALQFDPFRPTAQMWITSYASLFHRPGVPLFDLCKAGREGADPRLLFSWYSADYTSDPDFAEAPPELRANPSSRSWNDGGEYLAQQKRRLPSHKFRRLHLNLPGLPEGSAYSVERIDAAIERGVSVRPPVRDISYAAFCDPSGGGRDDMVLSIAHWDETSGRIIVDRVVSQGQPAPFDPNKAVQRFAAVLKEYRCATVTGDRYAGLTFSSAFESLGITYLVSERTKSEIYEAAEPLLNGHRLVLLDDAVTEQQALGLIWRGGKIDHPVGEHDDHVNAMMGACVTADQSAQMGPLDHTIMTLNAAAPTATAATESLFYGSSGTNTGGDILGGAFGGSGTFDPFGGG